MCPSLLVKKDRGRPTDPKARPRAFGEVSVASNVPGVELLQDGDGNESASDGSDDDNDNKENIDTDGDEENQFSGDAIGSEDDDSGDDNAIDEDNDTNNSIEDDSGVSEDDLDGDDDEEEELEAEDVDELEEGCDSKNSESDAGDGSPVTKESMAKKRKFSDFDGQLIAADTSLRALKRLAEAKIGFVSSDSSDGILSNEDFQRIKELKVCQLVLKFIPKINHGVHVYFIEPY